VTGAVQDSVERLSLEVHRHKLDDSGGRRQLGQVRALVALRGRMRSRVAAIRDVRQAGIGECATVGDEVSGPARAVGFHDSGALNRMTWEAVSL